MASIVTQDLNIFLQPRALIIHHHNNHNRYNNIRVHVCVVYTLYLVPKSTILYSTCKYSYALASVQYVKQFICKVRLVSFGERVVIVVNVAGLW